METFFFSFFFFEMETFDKYLWLSQQPKHCLLTAVYVMEDNFNLLTDKEWLYWVDNQAWQP